MLVMFNDQIYNLVRHRQQLPTIPKPICNNLKSMTVFQNMTESVYYDIESHNLTYTRVRVGV